MSKIKVSIWKNKVEIGDELEERERDRARAILIWHEYASIYQMLVKLLVGVFEV